MVLLLPGFHFRTRRAATRGTSKAITGATACRVLMVVLRRVDLFIRHLYDIQWAPNCQLPGWDFSEILDIIKVGFGLPREDERTTMPVMSKKKQVDAHRGRLVSLRIEDARLIEALDAYAAATRRSRNMGIIVLLEEALERAGFWPPGAKGKKGGAG
jgi:hypothetical protein